MSAAPNPESPVELRQKVAFLQHPEAYPEQPTRVTAIQTHMAWVFLTDRHAYKLKKPVRYGTLDVRTRRARRWACEEEVRLNRRLAGEVYCGVVPLMREAAGRLRLGGESGTAVDWLVKMRRLPAHRMLDIMIQRHTIAADDVQRVAQRMVGFYRALPPVEWSARAYVARIARRIDTVEHRLVMSDYSVPGDVVRAIAAAQQARLKALSALMRRRVRAGRLVEGHGDLRPEHICLTDPVVMIDCLEFDRALRVLDPVDELAFLAMECEGLGAGSIGTLIIDTYRAETDDAFPADLLSFYKSVRAMQRARIAVRHTLRPDTIDERRWTHQAEAYLRLAARHVGISASAD